MVDSGLIRDVRVHVIRTAMETAAVPSAQETAASLGIASDEATQAYRSLADAHAFVLEPGNPTRLRMANPFSGVPTAFSVEAAGKRYFGNCIWDGLGIVALMGGAGRVSTSCPDCGEGLALRVSNGVLTSTEGVVHFSVPASRWWDDIIHT